jgi:hypothetical protein
MGERMACEEVELLMDRLVRVESALFSLNIKSESFTSEDTCEETRLEDLRRELHVSYERLERLGISVY